MSTKKENILKRIGDFLDTAFTETENTTPIVEAAAAPPAEDAPVETPPAEEPKPIETKDLEDGVYIVKIVGGVIETAELKPEEAPEPIEEKTDEVKMSAEIKEKLTVEFETKLAAQKAEFELKLSELSKAQKASGIVQAPIETAPKIMTSKDYILYELEEKRKNRL